jgi:hypothetical protein
MSWPIRCKSFCRRILAMPRTIEKDNLVAQVIKIKISKNVRYVRYVSHIYVQVEAEIELGRFGSRSKHRCSSNL